MKGMPLIVASTISVAVYLVITKLGCMLCDALDRKMARERDRLYRAQRAAIRARSRAMHPSSSVRVLPNTRPFDFERDAR